MKRPYRKNQTLPRSKMFSDAEVVAAILRREHLNKPPAQRWQSNAEWDPVHGFPNNTTTDTHDTQEQADAVCRGLKREGLGGERIHFPVRTWSSPITEDQPKSGGE